MARRRTGNRAGEVRYGRLAGALGFNLRIAQEASFRAFAHRVGDAAMRPRRYAMLVLIRENPGLTQAELGRSAGREKSSITPALNDLVKLGLVERRAVAVDRRVQTLWLTRKGEQRYRELTRHAVQHDRLLERAIGRGNRVRFLGLLSRIVAAAQDYAGRENNAI